MVPARTWVPAGVVVATGLLLSLQEPGVAPALQRALAGAAAVGFATVAWWSAVASPWSADREAAVRAIAATAIAVQAVIFGIWWPATHRSPFAITVGETASLVDVTPAFVDGPVPPTGWLVGWAVAAALLLVARRRSGGGDRLVSPATLAIATAIVLGVADVALVAGLRDVALGDGTSAAVVVAAVAAIVPIVAVGILAVRGGVPAPLPAVAWALALLVPVSQAHRPTFGLSTARWLDLAAVAVPAVVLATSLAGARTDRSRRLAAGSRADEIIAGRAEIASMIAHEVRGPVTTIKGLAATTSGSYDRLSDAERRDFVGLIEDEAARLLDVVDRTALALRLDAGTLSFQRRAEELAPIVAEAVDRAPTDPHPVALDLAEGVVANVDRRWLGNAIGQGVSNAARFSPPDAPIDVRLRAEGGDAVIDILDRGPGVPPERRDEVFGRFVRWRPPGYEDRQGSGLGLFICRALLAEHAGDASIGIRAEGGTMLRLRLPMEGPGGG